MTTDGLAVQTLRRWRADPVAFARENFKVEPDAWQVDALRAFADPSKPLISLQACAGPGKSAVLAWCGWWFLSTQGEPGDHPKGYAVAVTGDNLRSNLWPELAKWQQRSKYLEHCFTWTSERIFQNEQKATWFLEARSWPKTASPEEQGKTLSGLHGDYVCALIDESGAIPGAVSRAAQQALSTGPRFGCVMQAGNPLSREGMLFSASRSSQWHTIRITGDPDDPKRSPRVSLEWARQQIAEYGRDNPWVQAYILGQFPDVAAGKLLSWSEVEAAMGRQVESGGEPLVLGVDVGLATDPALIYPRRGRQMFAPRVMRGLSTSAIASQVVTVARQLGAVSVFVDAGGPGIGVVDQCRLLGLAVVPVYFGGAADEPARYQNKRVEMYVRMAEWIREGGALDPHTSRELAADLTEPETGWHATKGVQILEPKDEVRKRLGRSSDWGDAAALTFAYPVAMPQMAGMAQAIARTVDPDGGWDRMGFGPQ